MISLRGKRSIVVILTVGDSLSQANSVKLRWIMHLRRPNSSQKTSLCLPTYLMHLEDRVPSIYWWILHILPPPPPEPVLVLFFRSLSEPGKKIANIMVRPGQVYSEGELCHKDLLLPPYALERIFKHPHNPQKALCYKYVHHLINRRKQRCRLLPCG